MEAEKTKRIPLGLHTVNGMPLPSFVFPEELERLKGMEVYPDDVWVVSYPKTGSTWTKQIVKLVRNNGIPDDVVISYSVPWIEAVKGLNPVFEVSKMARPRTLSSHFPYHLMPCGPPHTTPCKYIYVMRNPKDVAVSYYFHSKKTFLCTIDWESFWKRYIEGDVAFGNYFEHLQSWWPHRNDPNTLFLRFEDMKKNLCQAISQIASFIGTDLSDEIVAKIADLTSFEKMKDDKTANMTWAEVFNDGGKSTFMRKGEVGDWKNYLTAEQSAQLDAICAERLQGTGLEFDYE